MDQNHWEAALKKELKTDQIERFLKKVLPEGGEQPLLSQTASAWSAPACGQAALSYTFTGNESIPAKMAELGKLGAYDFIVDPFLLGWDAATTQAKLAGVHPENARLWVLGQNVIHAGDAVKDGAHAVHEMGLLLARLIDWAEAGGTKTGVAVTCDREFFKSVAKLRAMKAITWHMLSALKKQELFDNITWIARSSWRDFTAFDAASNILRNATALSAAFIGRADVVESLPYNLLIESDAIVHDRAQRLALTSQLVLQQESNLGEVGDAATGSYALEELTRTLGELAWKQMQELKAGGGATTFHTSVEENWKKTQKLFDTRRLVQTGVNDFPEGTERVRLKERFQKTDHVRLGRRFEELRLAAPTLKVAVPVIGDYAALNARLSFTKNFFELLGLEVVESGKGLDAASAQAWLAQSNAQVWAVVAADADHAGLQLQIPVGTRAYLAGKTPKAGMLNIAAGMDVRAALEELVQFGGVK